MSKRFQTRLNISTITEAEGGGKFFGMERLKTALRRNLGLSAQQVRDDIERELNAFRGTSTIADDVTMTGMRYAPSKILRTSIPGQPLTTGV